MNQYYLYTFVGDILVFLPSYQHVLRLNYILLKQRLLGNVPDFVMMHLLHSNMSIEDLEAFVQNQTDYYKQQELHERQYRDQHHYHWKQFCRVRIILATEFAECLSTLKHIRYIIDTGRLRRCVHNNSSQSTESIYEWVSRQTLKSRLDLLDREMGTFK